MVGFRTGLVRSQLGRVPAADMICTRIALASNMMKKVVIVIAVLLLVAVGLPLGMGTMGDCPMCTSPQSLLLGLCGVIVIVFVLSLSRLTTRVALNDPRHRLTLLLSQIFRPPRLV